MPARKVIAQRNQSYAKAQHCYDKLGVEIFIYIHCLTLMDHISRNGAINIKRKNNKILPNPLWLALSAPRKASVLAQTCKSHI